MVFGNQYPVFGKSCWLLVQLLLIAYLSLITEYRFLYSSAKISNSRLSLAKICAYVEMGLFLELAVGSRPELCALSPSSQHCSPQTINPALYLLSLYRIKRKAKLEKSLRYIRVNSRTVVGIRSDMPDDQVRKKFADNLKLSPYFNPKKFFVISKSRWI